MVWYENLFISNSIEKKAHKIVKKITRGSFINHGYLMCLSTNGTDMFEIISARELAQKHYPKDHLHVIGIFATWDEAVMHAGAVVQECIQLYGKTDLKQYYQGSWRDSFDFS